MRIGADVRGTVPLTIWLRGLFRTQLVMVILWVLAAVRWVALIVEADGSYDRQNRKSGPGIDTETVHHRPPGG